MYIYLLHLLYPVLCLCIPSKNKKFKILAEKFLVKIFKQKDVTQVNKAEGKCMFKIISEAKKWFNIDPSSQLKHNNHINSYAAILMPLLLILKSHF